MFIKTFKTSKAELAILLLGLLCFLATLWYIVSSASSGGTSRTSANSVTEVNHFLVNARTADDRVGFLAQFGWETEPDPIDVREVTIPGVFDDVYTDYNNIQKPLGFDLELFKGCRVKKWEYAVTNYPGNLRNVKATMLIYDGKVIGGDISSGGAERFIHSFLLPTDSAVDSREELKENETDTQNSAA